LSSTKWTSVSNVTRSRHAIADKLLIWGQVTFSHSLKFQKTRLAH